MTTWGSTLSGPWPQSELESILEDALRVLAEVGVACAHEATIARLRGKCGGPTRRLPAISAAAPGRFVCQTFPYKKDADLGTLAGHRAF